MRCAVVLPWPAYKKSLISARVSLVVYVSACVHVHMVDWQCGVFAVTMQCPSMLGHLETASHMQLPSMEPRRSDLARTGMTIDQHMVAHNCEVEKKIMYGLKKNLTHKTMKSVECICIQPLYSDIPEKNPVQQTSFRNNLISN